MGWRQRLATTIRSAGVGTAATVLDLAVLALLVTGLGVSPRVASVPALMLGVAAQFAGNKFLAFRDRSPAWFGQAIEFLGVEALAVAANLALFDLAMTRTDWPYLPVRLATTSLVYFLICLPLWSRIFKPNFERGRTC